MQVSIDQRSQIPDDIGLLSNVWNYGSYSTCVVFGGDTTGSKYTKLRLHLPDDVPPPGPDVNMTMTLSGTNLGCHSQTTSLYLTPLSVTSSQSTGRWPYCGVVDTENTSPGNCTFTCPWPQNYTDLQIIRRPKILNDASIQWTLCSVFGE